MNKYLLLRDNKQTGPYTAQELAEKGLKPYDLVWLEGRSAAWRYPGEIDELKSFAPGVEEQPYDRFYKKQDGQQSTQQAVAAVEESQPASKQVEKSSKHIYVTMPGGAKVPAAKKEEAVKPVAQQSDKSANSVTAKNTEKKAAASSYIISEEDDELNSSMLKGYNNRKVEDEVVNSGFLSDYESRKAAYSKGKSTGAAVAVKEKVAEKPVAPKKESWSTPAKKEQFDLKAVLASSGKYLQNNKNLTRVLVAVVLILGGVVIGLVINKGNHQPDTQALESLVKEIREQQNEKGSNSNTTPVTETAQQNNNNNRHNNTRQEEARNNEETQNIADPAPPPTASVNSGSPNQQRQSVIKKDINVVPPPPATNNNKSIALPASNTSNQPVIATPAVIETREKPINPEVIEKARKNIYEQVRAEPSAYKVGVFGGVSDLDITIVNTSLYALDQVAVEVKYFGMEKKLVKSQTIIFNNVPPGKRRTLEVPKTSRGITIECAIISINSKALGLAQAGF
jgi:hypothetical protein